MRDHSTKRIACVLGHNGEACAGARGFNGVHSRASASLRGDVVITKRLGVAALAGADVLSDPVELSVKADGDLAVDLYLPQSSGPPTWHFDARQTSYSTTGNQVGSATLPAATPTQSWFFLTDVEVSAERGAKGVVAF